MEECFNHKICCSFFSMARVSERAMDREKGLRVDSQRERVKEADEWCGFSLFSFSRFRYFHYQVRLELVYKV
jgi:hypothetical protein